MEIPTMFLERLLRNCAVFSDTVVERDVVEIRRRFEHEGMSFLTIALPSLCDTLDKGLSQGRISPCDFLGFKPIGRKGRLPRLLSGFFMRVFALDGSLLERPCIESIRTIRQVTRLFKKVELPCSSARVKRAFERYVSNEEKCSETQDADPYGIERIAGHLWSCLETVSDRIFLSHGIFGSGATAERLGRNARLSIKAWPSRGEYIFPLARHCVASEDDTDTMSGITLLKEDQELPVRVVTVPKTLKTPRIIAVEPSYMMLRQQQVAKFMMTYLEREYRFKGAIRFTDQTVNRDRARRGSIDGSLATIDLSDASDLVSNDLVKRIFKVAPSFLEMIQAARSNAAKVPGFGTVSLNKYASQGSALCFPIEAMVFYTIVVASVLKFQGVLPSTRRIADITAKVSVYGDDIIVPSETAEFVMDALETYGLKVNQEKSFHTGLFRESCGGDYYAGVDITPVYVRQWTNKLSNKTFQPLVAAISLSNQLYMKGYWDVAQAVRNHVERAVGPLARTTSPIGVLTWASVCFNTSLRWDVDLHCFRVRGPAVSTKRARDPLQDVRGCMFYTFQREGIGEIHRNLLLDGSSGPDDSGRRGVSRGSDPKLVSSGVDSGCHTECMRSLYSSPDHAVANGSPNKDQVSAWNSLWKSNPFDSPDNLWNQKVTSGSPDPELVVDSYASSIKRKWGHAYHVTVWR